MKTSVNISARHVHLNKSDLNILFGDGYELSKDYDLKQPGCFAAKEKVIIKTEKNKIDDVRVVGPIRDYTQVEVSKTDAYYLGIDPPVRASGDLFGSSGITIVGPKGSINLESGCIIAERHIHLTLEHMKVYNLVGKDKVDIFIPGIKGGIISNVKLKVSDNSYFELHLDTDDANAFLLSSGDIVEILEDKNA